MISSSSESSAKPPGIFLLESAGVGSAGRFEGIGVTGGSAVRFLEAPGVTSCARAADELGLRDVEESVVEEAPSE